MNIPIDLEPADDLTPGFSDSSGVPVNESNNPAPEVAAPEAESKAAYEAELLEYYFDNLFFSK